MLPLSVYAAVVHIILCVVPKWQTVQLWFQNFGDILSTKPKHSHCRNIYGSDDICLTSALNSAIANGLNSRLHFFFFAYHWIKQQRKRLKCKMLPHTLSVLIRGIIQADQLRTSVWSCCLLGALCHWEHHQDLSTAAPDKSLPIDGDGRESSRPFFCLSLTQLWDRILAFFDIWTFVRLCPSMFITWLS